jgi:transposase, IS5 family
MARPRDERQQDLLKPALDQIIDLGHPLARLAGKIDWGFRDGRLPRSVRRGRANRAWRPGSSPGSSS